MKQLSKIFLLMMILVNPVAGICQEPLELNHDVAVYYGVYGVREADDASLYKSTLSTGVFGARYTLNLNQKYSIGIEGAFENAEPELRSSTINENFYIKSFFLCGRLSYSFIKQVRFDLYVAGAFGIKRIGYVQKQPARFRMKEGREKLTLTCEPISSVQSACELLQLLRL